MNLKVSTSPNAFVMIQTIWCPQDIHNLMLMPLDVWVPCEFKYLLGHLALKL